MKKKIAKKLFLDCQEHIQRLKRTTQVKIKMREKLRKKRKKSK